MMPAHQKQQALRVQYKSAMHLTTPTRHRLHRRTSSARPCCCTLPPARLLLLPDRQAGRRVVGPTRRSAADTGEVMRSWGHVNNETQRSRGRCGLCNAWGSHTTGPTLLPSPPNNRTAQRGPEEVPAATHDHGLGWARVSAPQNSFPQHGGT